MPTLDELNAQISQNIDARKTQNGTNLIGPSTGWDDAPVEQEANDTSTLDLVKKGFESVNAGVGAYQWLERKGVSTDPDFNIADHWDDLKKDVPVQYWHQFDTVHSLQEANMLKNDIHSELRDLRLLGAAGARGATAMGLAGLVDVDAPLMFATEGTWAAGKLGLKAGRIANAVRGAEQGLTAGLVSESVNTMARPTGEWQNVPYAGLSGIVFGAGIGSMSKATIEANKAAQATRESFDEDVINGVAGRKEPFMGQPVYDDGFHPSKHFNDDSLGAASVADRPDMNDLTSGVKAMREDAVNYIRANDLGSQEANAFNMNTWQGKSASKLYDAIQKTPFKTDFDRLYNSDSAIATSLAYKMFESPAGIVRNNRSAAMIVKQYHNQIAGPVNTNYQRLFDTWAANRRAPNGTRLGEAWSVHKTRFDANLRNQFDQEVMEELASRYHDKQPNPNSHPAVAQMADHIDKASDTAVNLMKGRDGETAVRGSETLNPEKGWWPQRWRGDKIAKLVKDGRAKTEDIQKALENTYGRIYPDWDKDLVSKYAKAVTRRAAARENGIDANVATILQQEGGEYLEQMLFDSGFSRKEAQDTVAALRGLNGDKSKESILKHRRDIDMREAIPNTDGLRLMDILDTDIVPAWTSYTRQASGSSALARHGIQRADKKKLIDAIKEEQKTANPDRHISDETLDGMFSYFEGGAFGKGVNPWVRRALRVTNLSLLNGLGLTQMAELGVNIAAMGWENFMETLPKELRYSMGKEGSELMEELRPYHAAIDGEHMLYQDHLFMDEISKNPGTQAELGAFIDKLLTNGSRIQGFVSGFYQVKAAQQRLAIRGMTLKLAKHFRDDEKIGAARLRDLGINPAIEERIGKYFKDGTVNYDDAGDVLKLGFDKWRPDDIGEFVAAMNRHTSQVVQDIERGESSVWMHGDLGAVLMHLKSFTMAAVQKQLIRNMRIADTESTMSMIYGMMTAGLIYTAQQAIAGKDKNLAPAAIMRGAFNLNNMTSWLPQMTDPIASMLGQDDLRFSGTNNPAAGGDVVGIPPVLTTMNRIAHIPQAAVKTLTGNATANDIYALQATPLIGNAYGMSHIFNSMKQDIKTTNEQKYNEQHKQVVKQEAQSELKNVVRDVVKQEVKKQDKKKVKDTPVSELSTPQEVIDKVQSK